jgi:predicted PurR-regulated permease PerM
MNMPRPPLQSKTFVVLLVLVSVAFAWVIAPFYETVLWATVLAIMFAPLYRWLGARMGQRRIAAALGTVVIVVLLVIVPAILIAGLLVQEGLGLYHRIQSRDLDFGRYLDQMRDALPAWALGLLDRFGMSTTGVVQERLTAGLTRVLQYVGAHAVNVGQVTLDFILSFFLMLYLLFFLLLDGPALMARIRRAVPLDEGLQRQLGDNFRNVVRAIIKGTLVVALVQGALGGIIFAVLGVGAAVFWGVLMAFLSLLPAIGSALVWLPVALHFLVIGAIGKGLTLIAFGVLVIGLVDNFLRPLLVGKDTKMPDYVVLIATLGGMAAFGFNGFVIGPVIAALFIAIWHVVAQSRAPEG